MKITPEQLVEYNTITNDGLKIIEELINNDKNILIIGKEQTGKTTLIQVILQLIKEPKKIAMIRVSKAEKPTTKHKITTYDSIDDFIKSQYDYDLVIIDNHYTIDFAPLKRIKIPKIIAIQDSRIENRLHYIGQDIIDAIIKLRIKKDLKNIMANKTHIVDSIKIFDSHIKIYTPIYKWGNKDNINWEKLDKFLHNKPKTIIEPANTQ